MSNFYATFEDANAARLIADEFLRSGVLPDDLSLLIPNPQQPGSPDGLESMPSTVGDASSFVGRSDDPANDRLVPEREAFTDMQTTRMSDVGGGVDTSDSDTDVDSVDQMEDSQSEAEDQMYPYRETSQGDHEVDDLVLAVTTGFPTSMPLIDEVRDTETPVEDELADSAESLSIAGFGTIFGQGPLATAALGFGPKRADHEFAITRYLVEEGVPERQARQYLYEFLNGSALLSVSIAPGRIDETELESIARSHGARNLELYDSPRY